MSTVSFITMDKEQMMQLPRFPVNLNKAVQLQKFSSLNNLHYAVFDQLLELHFIVILSISYHGRVHRVSGQYS